METVFNTPIYDSTVFVAVLAFAFVIGVIYIARHVGIIDQYDRIVVLRLGKLVGVRGPGFYFLPPLCKIEDTYPVNDQILMVSIANVQTHDTVPVSGSLVITVSLGEASVAVFAMEVSDGWEAVLARAEGAAAEVISATTLNSLLRERASVNQSIATALAGKVSRWGVSVVACEIKDVKVSDDGIASALSLQAEAEKEAAAEMTRAEMQFQIAQKLNQAAAQFDDNGRWLKEREVLLELCRSASNNTVMIPNDLLKIFKA